VIAFAAYQPSRLKSMAITSPPPATRHCSSRTGEKASASGWRASTVQPRPGYSRMVRPVRWCSPVRANSSPYRRTSLARSFRTWSGNRPSARRCSDAARRARRFPAACR
jgi:hypothetical protein